MSQELLDAIAHIKRILAKRKTQPGQSEAATVPGVGGTGLSPVGTPTPGRQPNRGDLDDLPHYLRDLTYALDMLADTVARLSRGEGSADDSLPHQLQELRAHFDRWAAAVRPLIERQDDTLKEHGKRLIRVECRTDTPARGDVEVIRVQPQWERQLLWMGVGLSCALSCGTFALGLFWVLRGVL